MNRRGCRAFLATAAAGALSIALGCGEVSENDFGQTLSFDGFFTDETCGTGVVELFAFTSLPPADAASSNCYIGSPCIAALQVTNHTTGVPIPSNGGQGASGNPVPSTEGVRILPKNIHIEYALPVGQIPSRDIVMAGLIDPLGSECREFEILRSTDTFAMVQDPLSYPALPFTVRARVTYEGITGGGQDIRTSGDMDIVIF
ncbi:MAG: hypothetical protein U0610_11040 [bacterium]